MAERAKKLEQEGVPMTHEEWLVYHKHGTKYPRLKDYNRYVTQIENRDIQKTKARRANKRCAQPPRQLRSGSFLCPNGYILGLGRDGKTPCCIIYE
jgi:hypothetical protein